MILHFILSYSVCFFFFLISMTSAQINVCVWVCIDLFLLLFDASERGRVKHEGGAADGTRDSDTAVSLLLLQTADQHTGTQLMGEEVRPEAHTQYVCGSYWSGWFKNSWSNNNTCVCEQPVWLRVFLWLCWPFLTINWTPKPLLSDPYM